MLRLSYEIKLAKKIMEYQQYVRKTEEKMDDMKLYMFIGGLIVIVIECLRW